MTTFVLTHGAWGGSYGFHKVRRLLQAEGHEVFTPSLTGIGERSHLIAETIDLTTHVTDLVNAIEYEDLSDIVLLGFSYGGMVVTSALNHIGDRVSHLVYLDALVPADGQSAPSCSAKTLHHPIRVSGGYHPPRGQWPTRSSKRGPTRDAPTSRSAPFSSPRRSPHRSSTTRSR
ncbi:MAG: alpha/beta fold hydrolase [Acidimicrobiales bacterium]